MVVSLLIPATSIGQDLSEETQFRNRLVSPVSTKANRKGDKVNGIVQEPETQTLSGPPNGALA
jgi:hypothetical protein